MQRYCSTEVVPPVLKVESGLCLLDATLVASYLHICENPGPETRFVNGEAGNLSNIPVVTSDRLNYLRPFNRLTARSLVSIPIVNEQYRCARRHLRLCCLFALPDDYAPEPPPPLSKFSPLTEEKVRKLINSSTNKSCNLDPMPTSLVIDCIDVLLPIITKMINLSLECGLFLTGSVHLSFLC